eukprot:gnl/MRDRNA2_/MRDRNA2_109591_c0_seq1.p1 gnl/MRDRNA2_/MRDRNA2_109591_c0~~gnl/MRDRNA2_/MRDRNA2_109591_c0_seq1.p1  ORF type:complete len:565 (-),score=76.80 gnl/MRDRNA2_/MRDRNA2_109591_c0_seq1:134-1828(-)
MVAIFNEEKGEPLLRVGKITKTVEGDNPTILQQFFELPWVLPRWLCMLSDQYGYRLLVLLFASQHILKGLVFSVVAMSQSWIWKSYHVSGPMMQIYSGIVVMPWALKPISGMISDLFPIAGYNKAPYIIIVSLLGIAAFCCVGFGDSGEQSISVLVLCGFLISLQLSVCDLLTEAKYAEQLSVKPQYGPDLMTYVWSGITFGGLITTLGIGQVISEWGARFPYRLAIIPAASIFWPTLQNFMQETKQTCAETIHRRAVLLQQKECYLLCVLQLLATMFLSGIGMLTQSSLVHSLGALVTMVVVLVAFSVTLRPCIAKMNAFFLVQNALGLSIDGATFYFYTDGPAQYKDGPHFSIEFFTSVLGLVTSLCSLVGLAVYNRYMKNWTYRWLLLTSNIALTILSFGDLLQFSRMNLQLGIPDHCFVLGSSISGAFIAQWQWMPGVVMLSQMCPKGMEATMYALLAGCWELGNILSQYLGAYVLEYLKIKPTGSDNEDANFENLWIAGLISTVLPIITIVLIPYLIPDARQTDKLLGENDRSATEGSLWQQWFGKPDAPPASLKSAIC